jgi:hypothetical protein
VAVATAGEIRQASQTYCPKEMENGNEHAQFANRKFRKLLAAGHQIEIRLAGKWLERAGFKPGQRATVEISQPGMLTPRFLNQTGVDEQENNSAFQHSAT